VSLYGVADATASFVAGRLGNRVTDDITVTDPAQPGVFNAPTASTRTTSVPVVGAREIMYPPFGPYTALVHSPAVSARPLLCDFERP
jgi:hypothetical protein